MRKKLIAGNWKMNLDITHSEVLVKALKDNIHESYFDKCDVLICPPFTSLMVCNSMIKGTKMKLGAQNLYWEKDGAYTGEISATMLTSAGCEYVIIGHSERRQYFGETDETVNKKSKKALENNLKPILCVGESLSQREEGIFKGIVENQIKAALEGITKEHMKDFVIAYEPVWAIGTGLNASTEQISEMNMIIGDTIGELYDSETAVSLLILYGGSVNDKNAEEIFSTCGVDGALIGGASLKSENFINIIKSIK
ncbi:MAG: triose-phosphate isomerase [Ignavibacteria bacterium]|nr:triose-phosphate isomerase [Ignavibacteria bacterium]